MKKNLFSIFIVAILIGCNTTKNIKTFVIGSYTDDKNPNGLNILEINFKTHTHRWIGKSNLVANPSYLTFGENKNQLFAVSEIESGSVASLNIQNNNFTLNHTTSSLGVHPCHLTYINDTKNILVANYSSGTVGYLSSNGNILDSINHPKKESKAHYITVNPWDKKQAFGVDLGADAVYLYNLTNEQIKISDSISLPEGYGPRHLVTHPNKKWVYVVNELISSICFFEIDNQGKWHQKSLTPTVKNGIKSYCGAINIHPSGKYLYASNRGENTISKFNISEDGTPLLQKNISVEGDWPRFFMITKDGKHLISGNQRSNNITIFNLDSQGNMSKVAQKIDIPTPACILEF